LRAVVLAYSRIEEARPAGDGHAAREDRIRYDVALTYPGAAAEQTMTMSAVCSSDGEEINCDDLTQR
jgi:hypothetical protein